MGERNGTEWQETHTEGGITYTRTVKKVAAMAVAARLLQAANAGIKPQQADIERGKQIVKLAKWHRVQTPEGGRKSPQRRRPGTVTQSRGNFREIQRGRAGKNEKF